MTTLYNGGPVMGGTFPALIWASVMSAWEEIKAGRAAEKATGGSGSGGVAAPYVPVEPSTESAPEEAEAPVEPEAAPETEGTPEAAPEATEAGGTGAGGGLSAGSP